MRGAENGKSKARKLSKSGSSLLARQKKNSSSINKFVYMCDDDDMRSETKINI